MKVLSTGKEARTLVKKGIDLVANCVKTTLGSSGRNAILGRLSMNPMITNDGVTIAQYLESENEIEQLGVQLAQEVSRLTEISAGDGTTTATVLLQAIVDMGIVKIDDISLLKKVNSIQLRVDIDKACKEIVAELEKMAKQITSRKDIYKVARIAVENDDLANLITEIFDTIGKDGIITVEEGTFETTSEIVTGLQVDSGLLSPLFLDTGNELTIKKPKVLVFDGLFNNVSLILPLIKKLSYDKIGELVIFARDFSKEVIDIFIKAKITGDFIVIPIKATNPEGYQEKDVASLLGTVICGKDDSFITGTCDKIVIDKDKTLFIGGMKPNAQNRLDELKKELTKTTSEYDKNRLQRRISALSGGVAVIRVGAPSQSEREYLKAKLDDAVLATKYAMQEGVVAGGGLALKIIAEKFPKNILAECIKAPYNQIQENAGGLEIGKDIIDPLRVTKSALINACSVAGMVITTEVASNYGRITPKQNSNLDA